MCGLVGPLSWGLWSSSGGSDTAKGKVKPAAPSPTPAVTPEDYPPNNTNPSLPCSATFKDKNPKNYPHHHTSHPGMWDSPPNHPPRLDHPQHPHPSNTPDFVCPPATNLKPPTK